LIWKEKWNKTLEKLFSSLDSTKWLNFYNDFYAENQFRQYAISKNIGLKWPSYICSNDINYLNSFFESKKDRVLELMDQDCKKGQRMIVPGNVVTRLALQFLIKSLRIFVRLLKLLIR